MASLWKHPNSSFWTACYTDREGRQMKRSTRQTDKRKAMLIAVEYERVEAQARNAGVTIKAKMPTAIINFVMLLF
jgi:hypothetical protein